MERSDLFSTFCFYSFRFVLFCFDTGVVNNARASDHIVSDYWCRLPCIFFFFAELSLTRFNSTLYK